MSNWIRDYYFVRTEWRNIVAASLCDKFEQVR